MDEYGSLLRETIERGYVIKQPGEALVWKLFHAWCLRHAQPFVYVQLPTGRATASTVAIDLFTVGDRKDNRFTADAIAEAKLLLAEYPVATRGYNQASRLITITPLAIRHGSVLPDQAEALAQALLALYRRMRGQTKP